MARDIKGTIFILLAIGVFVAASLYIGYSFVALGNVTSTVPAAEVSGMFQTYSFFASSTANTTWLATTTSATSTNIIGWFDADGRKDNGYFVIAGAKKVEYYFTYEGSTSTPTGIGKFSVQVSPDGSTWYDFNKLLLSTSTTDSAVAAIFWSLPTTTVPVSMDLSDDTFYATRCVVQQYDVSRQTGQFKCKATAEF